MEQFLTQETPGKVMALLGTALFSMAFLFAVTATDSSFAGVSSGSNIVAYDIFAPSNVVAVVDTTANSYSKFLNVNLFAPAQASYALAADNIAFIYSNATDEVAMLTGIGQTSNQPQVAGAYVTALHSLR